MTLPASSRNEEQFDVVDTDDRVVATKSRSEVHRLRLLHRAVHVFVFRSDGCLLIHRRSDSKEEFPSVWSSSCSGHVSAGDGYDETARRELHEELGIRAAVHLLRKFPACPDTSLEFTVLYRADHDGPVHPDPGEISEIRWMTPTDIADWMRRSPELFSPAFRLVFHWFCSSGSVASELTEL